MAKYEGELTNMSDVCLHCAYLQQYLNGEITVERARENCALRCKQHQTAKNKGIYKFDVVYSLYDNLITPPAPSKIIGRGRVGKAEERYNNCSI